MSKEYNGYASMIDAFSTLQSVADITRQAAILPTDMLSGLETCRMYESQWKQQLDLLNSSPYSGMIGDYPGGVTNVVGGCLSTIQQFNLDCERYFESDTGKNIRLAMDSLQLLPGQIVDDYIRPWRQTASNFEGEAASSIPSWRQAVSGFEGNVASGIRYAIESLQYASGQGLDGHVNSLQHIVSTLGERYREVSLIGEEYIASLAQDLERLSVEEDAAYADSDYGAEGEEGDVALVQDISVTLNRINRNLYSDPFESLRSDLDKLVLAVDSIKSVGQKRFVVSLVMYLLSTFFVSPFGSNFFNAIFEGKDIKLVRNFFKNNSDDNGCFFVASHDVSVVGKSVADDHCPGKIGEGCVVRRVDRSKKQVMIETIDRDGRVVRGWVLKKYIRPVTPRKKRKPENKRHGLRVSN